MKPRDILDKLLQLKSTILDARKSCKVIISQPNLRSENGKAALTKPAPLKVIRRAQH